jgi:polyhydroxyalkanoate synthesis regulator phasin
MAQAKSGTKKASAKKGGAKRSGAKRSSKASARSSAAAGRSDKSVQAFREALDRSITLPRDRLQEVADDLVKRGRMTRDDANELVSNLVTRGRKQTEDLLKDLERLLEQARKELDARVEQARKDVDSRVAPTRKRVSAVAGRAGRRARDAADRPLAEADRLRRRAGVPGSPISAYDQLTATQVKSRLGDLTKADLRKVRTQEKRGKARKSVLAEIDTRLS